MADVLGKPTRVKDLSPEAQKAIAASGINPANAVVVVKEYVPGLTFREVRLLASKPDGISREKFDQIGAELDAKAIQVTELFTSGQFTAWLKSKGHTPESLGIEPGLASRGDMDVSNLLYTDAGWVVIDP